MLAGNLAFGVARRSAKVIDDLTIEDRQLHLRPRLVDLLRQHVMSLPEFLQGQPVLVGEDGKRSQSHKVCV